MPPQAMPGRQIALVLLSADYRRSEELLRILEYRGGQGRYAVTWVENIEGLMGAMQQRTYDACLLDLASPQIGRLEGDGYRWLGNTPYLAVLTTPSLNDGDPLLQQLDARGYYAYVGYPFDGSAVEQVLRQILQQMQPAPYAPPQMPGNGQANGQPMAAPAPVGSSPMSNLPTYVSAPPAMPAPPPAQPPVAMPTPMPMQPPAQPPVAMPTPMPMQPPVQQPVAMPTPAPMPAQPPPAAAPAPSSLAAMYAPLPPGGAPAGAYRPPAPLEPTIQASAPPATVSPTPVPTNLPTLPATELGMSPAAAPMAAPIAPVPSAALRPMPAPQMPYAPAEAMTSFAIQPQLVRHRGLFVCWSPFDGAQRTSAALNLATALAFGGFRTLVGELRRPAGPLSSYLQLTKDELSRSLLAAAYASERLLAQKGYPLDQELLEDHLLNAIPLDPRQEDSPEVHFFLSGPSASPQLLYNAPALDVNQSPFVPEMLQMIRQYWDFAFIIVGSSPVDKLHWQAFRACDRLLIFLPPDAAYISQVEQVLPPLLRAARISPANVDVILTQADRGLLAEQLDPIMRFLAKNLQTEDRQSGTLRGMLSRRQPMMEERYLRALERQLRKLLEDGALRGSMEEDVRAMLKACGLDDKLAGVLPDALPMMRSLRRQNRLLLPIVMQLDYATTPYALAIQDLLGAWIQIASPVSGQPGQYQVAP
jgi:cellulose biosynthesis protein BcsQ